MQLRKEPAQILPTALKVRSGRMKYVIATIVFVLIAAWFWYYFFGRKPRVVMSIPVKEAARENGCWPAGDGQVVLVSDEDVKLCDLRSRTEKWSVKLPPKPIVDIRQREVNVRFAKLQQWADELAVKRNALTTPEATQQFNQEVAKYQAELIAARASAAKLAPLRQPPAVSAPETAAISGETIPAFGADRSKADKLNSVTDVNVKLIEGRNKKRAQKIAELSSSIEAKRSAAKTDFQKSAIKDEEKRLAGITAEQKADEDSLSKPQPAPKPEPPVAAPPLDPPEVIRAISSVAQIAPQVVPLGDIVWIVDSTHAVAFERSSGQVKQDVPFAGTARKVLSGNGCVFVVAQAGSETSQVTRLRADAAPQSLYVMTGREERAFQTSPNGDREANVQAMRVEFGGQLVCADIRLVERRLKTRDKVNPGTEKKLTQTIAESAGNSNEEVIAISKLMANDAQRLMGGEGREMQDDSTYDVTMRNPFEPSAPAWKGQLRGRVQLISTPHINFLTAGTQLFAFTPDNKKIWEATLGAPLPIHESDYDSKHEAKPWLEAGAKLYFADGAFLTSFDIASGQVQWRLPSVGIRKLQLDVDGNLYVASENLPTDSLFYALDADSSMASPSVMKVSAADGKIMWQADKYQDVWVSGMDVYAYRKLENLADFQNIAFDRNKVAEARIKIYKLKRSDGKVSWEWFQSRRPRAVIADRKNVALLFSDELQVIHSISL